MAAFFPTKIVLHHSGTEDNFEVSINAIRKWHVEQNKWSDIGYHALVELINDVYEIFIGRPWYVKGAHTIGYNGESLGVCLVGNFSKNAPPQEQLEKTAILVGILMDIYGISKDEIYLHKELNETECPGEFFDKEKFISLL